MEKEKKYKFIISAITVVVLLAFGAFYLFSSNIITINSAEEQEIKNPENLFEGSIMELTDDYLILNVSTPEEISGDSVRINVGDNTKYEELKLEVYSMDDVRQIGTERVNFDRIEAGDEALVAVSKSILDNIGDNSEFTAKIITKITSQEVE